MQQCQCRQCQCRRARFGQPGRARQTVLARTGPSRGHGHFLGRSRRHPPQHRRHTGQNRALAPVPHRPSGADRHRGPTGRPPPLPPAEPGTALEIDRIVSRVGLVSLGNRQLLAAEVLGGRRVTIRIEDTTLMFFDPDTRELLRTRPNPLSWDQARTLRGARPAGPPPAPR